MQSDFKIHQVLESRIIDHNTEMLYEPFKDILKASLTKSMVEQLKQAQIDSHLSHHSKKLQKDQRTHIVLYILNKYLQAQQSLIPDNVTLHASFKKSSEVQELRNRNYFIVKSTKRSFEPLSEEQFQEHFTEINQHQKDIEIVYQYDQEPASHYLPNHYMNLDIVESRVSNFISPVLPFKYQNSRENSTKQKSNQYSTRIKVEDEKQEVKPYDFSRIRSTASSRIKLTQKPKYNFFSVLDQPVNVVLQKGCSACTCPDNQIIASKIYGVNGQTWEQL